jgi:glycosyltransferase involved in cell wall biosynthesis
MRVALVTETWQPCLDGVVTRLSHTVDELVARGHQVLVVAPTTSGPLAGVVQARTRGFVVPFIDLRRRWGLPDGRVPEIVRSFAPDVVHVVSPVLMGTWAVRQLVAEVPLVVSLHTDLDAYASRYHLGFTRPLLRRLNRAAYRPADLALATSPTGVDLLAGLGVANASIWPPAVDRKVFTGDDPAPAGRSARDLERVLDVVCVGRLAREKHYDVLRPVVGPGDPGDPGAPEVRLTFVGEGPDRRRLRRVFAGTQTTFLGRVHGDPLAQAYRAADVVAFTSTTDTVGLVLLEAAALGRPVVAVDTRASRDTLAGYPRARLVAPDASAQEWRTALSSAACTTPTTAGTSPGWGEATDVLLRSYDELLARGRRAAG